MFFVSQGRYPESPPTTLPSPNSRRQQDIEIIDEDESSDVNTSVESTPIISTENEDDADVHTSDLPKNIIMVTSISDGSNEVTNFTGEKVSPNTNNYRVTNFLKARTEESNSSNGVVNLSYEEDSVSENENKGNSKKTVLFRNVSPQQPGKKGQTLFLIFNFKFQNFEKQQKYLWHQSLGPQ